MPPLATRTKAIVDFVNVYSTLSCVSSGRFRSRVGRPQTPFSASLRSGPSRRRHEREACEWSGGDEEAANTSTGSETARSAGVRDPDHVGVVRVIRCSSCDLAHRRNPPERDARHEEAVRRCRRVVVAHIVVPQDFRAAKLSSRRARHGNELRGSPRGQRCPRPPCRRERRLRAMAHAPRQRQRGAHETDRAAVTEPAPCGSKPALSPVRRSSCGFCSPRFVTSARFSCPARSTLGATPRPRSASSGKPSAAGGSALSSVAKSSSRTPSSTSLLPK